jgi:heme A synthase
MRPTVANSGLSSQDVLVVAHCCQASISAWVSGGSADHACCAWPHVVFWVLTTLGMHHPIGNALFNGSASVF